jgi:hypothetical protein
LTPRGRETCDGGFDEMTMGFHEAQTLRGGLPIAKCNKVTPRLPLKRVAAP